MSQQVLDRNLAKNLKMSQFSIVFANLYSFRMQLNFTFQRKKEKKYSKRASFLGFKSKILGRWFGKKPMVTDTDTKFSIFFFKSNIFIALTLEIVLQKLLIG